MHDINQPLCVLRCRSVYAFENWWIALGAAPLRLGASAPLASMLPSGPLDGLLCAFSSASGNNHFALATPDGRVRTFDTGAGCGGGQQCADGSLGGGTQRRCTCDCGAVGNKMHMIVY